MGVSDGDEPRSASAVEGNGRTRGGFDPRRGPLRAGHRLPVGLGVGGAGLVGLSGTAGAHGPLEHGGDPVAFVVVVGLPIVAGLGGAAIAVRRTRADATTPFGHPASVVLGLTLAVLGLTFAASAVTTSRTLGIVGGVVGALSVRGASRSGLVTHRGCHADLALCAVSAHRLFEGVAIGALYSAGATVGLLGATLLAGHTAIETAAVGGLYATGQLRSRGIGAAVLVQAGYAGGAVAGLGYADLLPVSARTVALAIAGGALLIVGAGEVERSIAAG